MTWPGRHPVRGVPVLRINRKNRMPIRSNIAWLAVAALLWSSGQGIALSGATGMWDCVMLPGGGMPQSHDGHRKSDVPADTGHGFCPVCSLTGCGAAAVTLVGELKGFTARPFDTDGVLVAAQSPRAASPHRRPPVRAPPPSV